MTTESNQDIQQAISANLARRFGAIIYDLVILFAFLLFSIGIITIPLGMIFEYHLSGENIFFRLYLLLIIIWFYAYFWIKGGQTLGMRAWRIKVVTLEGRPLTLQQALIRFFSSWLSTASIGIGFLTSLWDQNQQTWHDHLSQTRLVIVEKSEFDKK